MIAMAGWLTLLLTGSLLHMPQWLDPALTYALLDRIGFDPRNAA